MGSILIRFFYYFIWRVGAAFYFAGIVENGCGCFCFLIIFMQNSGIFRSEIFNNKNRQRQIDVKALMASQIFVSGLLVNKKARKLSENAGFEEVEVAGVEPAS